VISHRIDQQQQGMGVRHLDFIRSTRITLSGVRKSMLNVEFLTLNQLDPPVILCSTPQRVGSALRTASDDNNYDSDGNIVDDLTDTTQQ
jgi:hypothetical protein